MEFINELVAMSIDEITGLIASLKISLQQDDTNGSQRNAHAITGVAVSIGAETVSAASADIEQAAKNKDLGQKATLLYSLEQEFEKLKIEMHEEPGQTG